MAFRILDIAWVFFTIITIKVNFTPWTLWHLLNYIYYYIINTFLSKLKQKYFKNLPNNTSFTNLVCKIYNKILVFKVLGFWDVFCFNIVPFQKALTWLNHSILKVVCPWYIMYLLNRGCYSLTLCKTQTKPDRIKECNIEIPTLHKICKSLICNKPIKVELQLNCF